MEHAAILVRDAQLVEAMPQPAQHKGVVREESAGSWRDSIREGWKHWVTLNSNNLVWTALVVGGFFLTTLLMRG